MRVLLYFFFAALLVSDAFAQEAPQEPASLEAKEDRLPLSVQDCVRMALENNLEITIERLNPQLDDASILSARGAFDPSLAITPTYAESAETATGLSESRTASLKTGFTGKIPTGTTYDVGLDTNNSRTRGNGFEDNYGTHWGGTVSQPLLKGFGFANQLNPLRIARKQKEISLETLAFRVMDVVTQTKRAYYELVFAIENRRVQLQALDLAVKTLEDDRKRVEIGIKAPLDVSQAEAAVAQQEVVVLVADQEVSARMNALRRLISREFSEIHRRTLSPVERPSDDPLPPRNLEDSLETAFVHRPDYRQLKMEVEKQNIQLKYAENQRLPQVDLTGTYGFNGLGPDFPNSVSADADSWLVGLTFKMPLPDQAGQAQVKTAELNKEKSLLAMKQKEQTVFVEVDNALDAVDSSYKRIQATRAATRHAQAALSVETQKLRVGTTTSFQVTQLQKQLADAQSAEIRALVDYNIAKDQLFQAEGTSLQVNEIEIEK
jgi:outer membrane protein TolC